MSEYLQHLLPNFILVSSMIIIWYKLVNKKIDFNNKKLYITIILLMITSILNYLLVDKFIRIIVITILFMFFFRYLFKENLKKCIITPIYYQLIIMFCETLYALILTIIFGSNPSFFVESFLYQH